MVMRRPKEVKKMRRPKDMNEFDMMLREVIDNKMKTMKDPNKVLNVSMRMTDEGLQVDFKEV
tara:strand:- start:402 stop:587 length:186 start_codon:yes stop_codon:yes gene_type:complete